MVDGIVDTAIFHKLAKTIRSKGSNERLLSRLAVYVDYKWKISENISLNVKLNF